MSGEQTKWCPLGRISLQKIEGSSIQAVSTGAFNLVTLANADKGVPYPAATCMKNLCPLYRRGINPWGWGRCTLAKTSGWFLVLAAMLIAISLLSLPFLLRSLFHDFFLS